MSGLEIHPHSRRLSRLAVAGLAVIAAGAFTAGLTRQVVTPEGPSPLPPPPAPAPVRALPRTATGASTQPAEPPAPESSRRGLQLSACGKIDPVRPRFETTPQRSRRKRAPRQKAFAPGNGLSGRRGALPDRDQRRAPA